MGATVNLSTFSDADGVAAFELEVNAAPLNLTGSILRMMIRHRATDAEVPISLTSVGSDGITITDAVGGAFTLTIPRAKLSRLAAGDYVHSLIRQRPDGLFEDVWHGALTHQIGPTR
jgi:hypothetical protein